jgi:fructose-1-phosphate kinase PfkB-like protein
MSRILVVGVNPAWQKILEFDSFRTGEVNRARNLVQLASGKGMNAAKVLRRLGHEVHLLQLLGGANGQRCLVACQALDIRSIHVWVEQETRECMTLVDLDCGTATEVIEPFEAEIPGLDDILLDALPRDPSFYDAALICGTLPTGIPPSLYARVLERCRPGISLVDAWKGVEDALIQATVVKINRAEYQALPEDLRSSGILFLVTDGGREASILREGKTVHRLEVPRLDRVLNPIGAGDTVSAGTLHHLLDGAGPHEAFRRALAMGSASCLDLEPAQFSMETYERLLAGLAPARSED